MAGDLDPFVECDKLRKEVNQLKECIVELERENAWLIDRLSRKSASTTDLIEVLGKIKGDIAAKSVIVDRDGEICGSVRAETLTISGSVDGQIEAQSVALTSTARVTGDLMHGTITVEPGASVEARIHAMPLESEAPHKRPVTREDGCDSAAAQTSVDKAPAAVAEPDESNAPALPMIPLRARKAVQADADPKASGDAGKSDGFVRIGTAGQRRNPQLDRSR